MMQSSRVRFTGRSIFPDQPRGGDGFAEKPDARPRAHASLEHDEVDPAAGLSKGNGASRSTPTSNERLRMGTTTPTA